MFPWLLDDPYVAYCFDEAVVYFGTEVDNRLDAVEGKTPLQVNSKRANVLSGILHGKAKAKYADPLASGKRIKNA